MAYPADSNGIVNAGPNLPGFLASYVYYRAGNYPDSYRALGARLGQVYDSVRFDAVTHLVDAQAAVAEANAFLVDHSEDLKDANFEPQDAPPSMLLPPVPGNGWEIYLQRQGYSEVYKNDPSPLGRYLYLRGKAEGLTGGAVAWQMYGIFIAEAVDKCLNFGAHGGRHKKGQNV